MFQFEPRRVKSYVIHIKATKGFDIREFLNSRYFPGKITHHWSLLVDNGEEVLYVIEWRRPKSEDLSESLVFLEKSLNVTRVECYEIIIPRIKKELPL